MLHNNLPSEPETSVEYPLWSCGGGGQSFMIASVIQITVEGITKICNDPTTFLLTKQIFRAVKEQNKS